MLEERFKALSTYATSGNRMPCKISFKLRKSMTKNRCQLSILCIFRPPNATDKIMTTICCVNALLSLSHILFAYIRSSAIFWATLLILYLEPTYIPLKLNVHLFSKRRIINTETILITTDELKIWWHYSF